MPAKAEVERPVPQGRPEAGKSERTYRLERRYEPEPGAVKAALRALLRGADGGNG